MRNAIMGGREIGKKAPENDSARRSVSGQVESMVVFQTFGGIRRKGQVWSLISVGYRISRTSEDS